MSGRTAVEFTQGERIKRVFILSFALVLFALGVLLLIEPLTARGAEPGKVMDNVGGTAAANTSCASA